MSIVCISNLKGGVGKSSLSVNTAHALTRRGCEVLLVDIDPQNATSMLLNHSSSIEANERASSTGDSLLDTCLDQISYARPGLSILSLGSLIARLPMEPDSEEARVFGKLLQELSFNYDFLLVDTPPYWCGALAATLAVSSLGLVPIDPSILAVEAAIELLKRNTQHTDLQWMLQRTLVNRQAKRVSRIATEHLEQSFHPQIDTESGQDEQPKKISLQGVSCWEPGGLQLFLSRIAIPRSEQVHRLGFSGKTLFDTREIPLIREGYEICARQIEALLACQDEHTEEPENDFLAAFASF